MQYMEDTLEHTAMQCYGKDSKASMIDAARYKREAERLKVQEDLAETEKKRTELRGLLAMYSNQ